MRKALSYLLARLNERSTLHDIAAGMTMAAVLPAPWSFACFAVCLAKALIPDGKVKK